MDTTRQDYEVLFGIGTESLDCVRGGRRVEEGGRVQEFKRVEARKRGEVDFRV